MVYEGVEGKTNYSQVYVLLVILLLFSQDDVFNESIQKIVSIVLTCAPKLGCALVRMISDRVSILSLFLDDDIPTLVHREITQVDLIRRSCDGDRDQDHSV